MNFYRYIYFYITQSPAKERENCNEFFKGKSFTDKVRLSSWEGKKKNIRFHNLVFKWRINEHATKHFV